MVCQKKQGVHVFILILKKTCKCHLVNLLIYLCRTVQKILASILLIAFMGHTFNQGWYYLGYAIQKKEYMNRCVNKARPQMHCNGKCQLMKKIQEQEEKERGLPPELKLASVNEIISSRSFFTTQCPVITFPTKNKFFDYTIGSPIDRPSALFHPPNIMAWIPLLFIYYCLQIGQL